MTDKKITDEEIKSSLEVIATTRNCNECKIRNCKWGTCNCSQITANAAIDLINRQQAEIERLEKIRKADNNLITSLNKCYETAKAEAYKEFAEKLKEKCYEDFQETDEMLSPYVTDDDIDNLLKEMEGEE